MAGAIIVATLIAQAVDKQGINLSWDGKSLAWKKALLSMEKQQCAEQGILAVPELPTVDIALRRVYLPMEWLLVRYVCLPLKQASMVDAEMLFQELADSSDIEADDWWLTWHLHQCDEGVAGMGLGIPESLRESMQLHESWASAQGVLVDGYERLHAYIAKGEPRLVLDQDEEGIFFGVYDGQLWRGMRRLNGDVEQCVWSEILYSCASMGFDSQKDAVCGRVDDTLLLKLEAEHLLWQGQLLEQPKTRHETNLKVCEASEKSAMNLRHGRWAVRHGWGYLRVWKRSAALSVLVLLAWLMGVVGDLNRMDHQIKAYEQRIEAAFHQGLPNEPVMLDALAQLRQAAGGSASADTAFLGSLQAVSKVYRSNPWQLKTLELHDGEMNMTGETKDIESLNQMLERLKQALQKDVRIADTNISGKQVSFRMHW